MERLNSPLDYSLLGWLFSNADKADQHRIKNALDESGDWFNFLMDYSKPGCNLGHVPASVGKVFNDILLEDAEAYRGYLVAEIDLLKECPGASEWILSRSNVPVSRAA